MSSPVIRQIVALGGGGFSMEETPVLDDYILSLAGARPRVCFLPTASGDSEDYIDRFYEAFRDERCQPTHVSLFRRDATDLRSLLLSQDIVYVGGGNTANLVAIWRTHGADTLLREAWESGIVLAGLSAGSLCWFESGVTDSFGPMLSPFHDGLGFLPGSHCPHYDSDSARRPSYQRAIASEVIPEGIAADDGAALHFLGTELHRVVASRPMARAYRVVRSTDAVVEQPIATELLV